MKSVSLNLVKSENSDVDYKITKFPDGQQDLTIISHFKIVEDVQVRIKSHLNSFQDLEIIICAAKALQQLKIKDIELYIPYLLGARSDRKFKNGGVNYLRDIISPIINSIGFSSVIVTDPHSDVSEAVLNNFRKEPNFLVASWALDQILDIEGKEKLDDLYMIVPDAGALKKGYDLVGWIQKRNNIGVPNFLPCSKHRDIASGEILDTIVPKDKFNGETCFIVDDICSKGGTFKSLSKKLKSLGAGNIYLIVTHYEGTANPQELMESGITQVFTTNSICDVDNDFVKQLDIF
jgi:ribose-phosphate pyrophosphokinase